jgi:Fe-S-cluster containining protein
MSVVHSEALARIPVKITVVKRPDERRSWGYPFARWVKSRKKAFDLAAKGLARGRFDERAVAKVPCNGCTACCRSGLDIDLEDFETGAGLDTFDAGGGKRRLHKNPDGSCVHFVDSKCSVYDRRPVVCRAYDCRDYAAGSNLHSPDAAPVNVAILSWEAEVKTKADADAWMIVGLLVMAFVAKGKSPGESFVRAIYGHGDFMEEADGIRALALAGLKNSAAQSDPHSLSAALPNSAP